MRPSLASGRGRSLPGVADGTCVEVLRGVRGLATLRPLVGLGLALLFVTASTPTAAQQREPTSVSVREVERGFWLGSRIGAVYYFQLPGENAASSFGSVMGVEAGVDLGRDLQLGVVAWGQSVGAPADYKGITDDALDPKRSRGDFQTMMLGAMLRYSFLRFADDNGIDRTFVYARVAGGATLSRPVGIVDEQGYFASGGLGMEYFTRLRHFSVGLEIDAMSLIGDSGTSLGVAALPHVKYTF